MNKLDLVNKLYSNPKQRVLIETHDEHEANQIWVQGRITHLDTDFDTDGDYCLNLKTHLLGDLSFYKDDIINIEEFGFYK